MFGFNVNFGEQIEVFDCIIEIDSNGNKQSQRIHAPRIMIERQFLSLVQQAAQNANPTKVKLSRKYFVQNNFTDEIIKRENFIIFANDAYGEYEEQI